MTKPWDALRTLFSKGYGFKSVSLVHEQWNGCNDVLEGHLRGIRDDIFGVHACWEIMSHILWIEEVAAM